MTDWSDLGCDRDLKIDMAIKPVFICSHINYINV